MPAEPATEVQALAPPQWPLWARHGSRLTRARTRLTLTLTPACAPWVASDVIDALAAHDALAVAVRLLPGLRVPVLHAHPAGPVILGPDDAEPPLEGAPGVIHRLRGPAGEVVITVSAPTAVLDTRALELLGRQARRVAEGVTVDEPDLGYLDVVEWYERRTGQHAADGLSTLARSLAVHDQAETAGTATLRHRAARERTVTALLAAAAARQCDPSDLLAATGHLLLTRTGRTTATVVARLLNGRALPELSGVVGRLDLAAPVEADLAGCTDTDELLHRVRAAAAAAQARYEDDPATVALAAAAPSSAIRLAVTTVAATQPDPGEESLLRVTVQDDDPGPGDVVLRYRPGPDAGLELWHDPGRCGAAELDRFEERVTEALTAWIGPAPAAPLVLDLVGPDERRWLKHRLTGARADDGTPLPIVADVVLRHGVTHPESAALVEGQQVTTYGALRSASLALRDLLRARLTGPEPVVAVLTDRLITVTVSTMGVWAAGGAVAPLDPGTPTARMAALLARAGVTLMLTDRDVPGLPPTVEVLRVDLVPPRSDVPQDVPDAGTGAPHPAGLAYVVFTSGSTGEPKAVAVEHQQLAHYVSGVAPLLGAGRDTRSASPAPFSVDLGYTTLFPTLAVGGTVVGVPPSARLDPVAFAACLTQAGVDVLKITPSHLASLLSASGTGCLPSRRLVLGGERIPAGLVERISVLRPDLVVVNHYGPTETTVGSFAGPVTTTQARPGAAGSGSREEVPIGSPLPHVRATIVDERGSLAPTGAVGRLLVGGHGVARGYLADPRTTADRFRPDSAGPPGARVYDTGDLCRVQADGLVRFEGRVDDQVKIRGYRVEPGELEATIATHEGVRTACVVAVSDGGGTALHAFVAPCAPCTEAELADFLRERLPEACLPSRITVVSDLPLLPNGKIDRENLVVRARTSVEGLAPRDDLERVLTIVWGELIGVPELGVDVDVFRAGAHSLTATQALSRFRELLDIELTVDMVFRYRTVETFAAMLRSGPQTEALRARAAVVAEVLTLSDDELEALDASEVAGQ